METIYLVFDQKDCDDKEVFVAAFRKHEDAKEFINQNKGHYPYNCLIISIVELN